MDERIVEPSPQPTSRCSLQRATTVPTSHRPRGPTLLFRSQLGPRPTRRAVPFPVPRTSPSRVRRPWVDPAMCPTLRPRRGTVSGCASSGPRTAQVRVRRRWSPTRCTRATPRPYGPERAQSASRPAISAPVPTPNLDTTERQFEHVGVVVVDHPPPIPEIPCARTRLPRGRSVQLSSLSCRDREERASRALDVRRAA